MQINTPQVRKSNARKKETPTVTFKLPSTCISLCGSRLAIPTDVTEYYTIHVIKVEKDEKGNDMKRIVPIQKCINSPLPRVRMVCIAENGQYTSTDSFKFCSRVIHKELLLAFDYHSLRHTHATLLIANGADVKDIQTRLGHTNIETTLQTYVHDTEKMVERSVDLFEQVTQAKTS